MCVGAIPTALVWPALTVTFATAKAMHGIEFESRNPADWAHGVTCAVFLIHGKSDKTIPYKLFLHKGTYMRLPWCRAVQ